MLLNCTNKCFLDSIPYQGCRCLTTSRPCGGACIWRDHVHRKTRARLGGVANALYGMCICVRVRKFYGPIAAWSDCSVIFTDHTHVQGRMETGQHNTEGAIIYYVHEPAPAPAPAPGYVRKETQLLLHQGTSNPMTIVCLAPIPCSPALKRQLPESLQFNVHEKDPESFGPTECWKDYYAFYCKCFLRWSI